MENSSTSKKTHLKNLYLDPNNYRFIDNEQYKWIDESHTIDKNIQQRTRNIIAGKGNENLEDLIKSFKANGYLPVDQIQVKKISDNQYLVLEGNRRVATLKHLEELHKRGGDIGKLDPTVFRRVPVVYYDTEEDEHHQIVMGLKHISGNKKWPALNQAQYLKDLIDKHHMHTKEVAEALGISMIKLKRSLRTLALIEEYKKSDYGDQFESEMYSIFEEIVRMPVMRDWIAWDESASYSTNKYNRDRLFSWMSEDEEIIREDEDGEVETKKVEKIITKSTDIRDLAEFINDEKAITSMENSRSIAKGYALSDKIKENKFENALEIIEEQVNEATIHSSYAKNDTKDKIKEIINKMTGLAASKGFSDISDNRAIHRNVVFHYRTQHLSKIIIKNYKKLMDVELPSINRINIFAGINNAGKTSLLESIYLLTRQNDIYGLFDVYRRRGKFSSKLHSVWFNNQPIDNFEIVGEFDQKVVSVKIHKGEEKDEKIEKSSYLSTVQINSKINGSSYQSKARIYKDKEHEVFFKDIHILCHSVFSSPFSFLDQEQFIAYHEKSVETQSIDRVISFLREKVDSGIEDIELAGELTRFLVSHKLFDKALDLTQFGEGIQRMFHIALKFASAENGILLIDELENAIHYTLLRDFVKLIVEMADSFNVQVFLTSHSKECINAFLHNGTDDKISAYRLSQRNGQTESEYISGADLAMLVDAIDVDLRGGK